MNFKNIIRFGWLIHLTVFLIMQLIFLLLDGSPVWNIFNVNELGLKAMSFIYGIFTFFHPYDMMQLNFITLIWGIALILHSMEKLLQIRGLKQTSTDK